jgi:hypothetical protein
MPTAEEYGRQIVEMEAAAKRLRDQLVADAPHIYDEIAVWARAWTQTFVSAQIREEAAVTTALDSSELSALKAEVAGYLVTISDRTTRVLDEARIGEWLHRPKDADADSPISWFSLEISSTHATTTFPRSLDEPMRQLLGGILPILRKRGYFTPRHGYPNTLRSAGDRFPFAVPEAPPAVIDALRPYHANRTALIDVLKELRDLRRRKDEAEAAELWDKA